MSKGSLLVVVLVKCKVLGIARVLVLTLPRPDQFGNVTVNVAMVSPSLTWALK
jgi:hypothetical protein